MVVALGGKPVFADSDPQTLLIDPQSVEKLITPQTKAIVGVDYGGHPSPYDELQEIAERNGLYFISDACHAIGALYQGQNIGSIAQLNTFSFHPVKPLTTGEGGMITTNDPALAQRMRQFRNHAITKRRLSIDKRLYLCNSVAIQILWREPVNKNLSKFLVLVGVLCFAPTPAAARTLPKK
jgi:dTDP-4-amino-4,6-dideoxygalactose transaminase